MKSSDTDRNRSNGASGAQRDALKIALRSATGRSAITPGMALAVREICSAGHKSGHGPERALVEFKLSLTDAANDVELPLGPERSKLLSGLVSLFIEELYRPAGNSNAKPRAFDCGDASQKTQASP